MSFVKKAAIVGGLLFIVFVAAATYISQQSMKFKDYHEPFVREFMDDLTYSWDVVAVKSRFSEAFVEQSETEAGQAYLQQFSDLGQIKRIHDINAGKYYSGSDGVLGEIIFTAEFEHEDVLVRLTLHELSGEVRVQGLTINSLDPKGKPVNFHEAQ